MEKGLVIVVRAELQAGDIGFSAFGGQHDRDRPGIGPPDLPADLEPVDVRSIRSRG
jgi:hypothetical protein